MNDHMTLSGTTGKASVGKTKASIRISFNEDEFESYEQMKHFMVESESDVTIEVVDDQGNLFEDDEQAAKVNGRATVRQFATNKDGVSATFSFGDDVSDKPMGKLADGTVKIIMQRVKDAAASEEPLPTDE